MSSTPTPWVTLGVARDANEKTVRSAYHRLAREHHPDKIRDPTRRTAGEEMFKIIQHAYELLTNKVKRTEANTQPEPDPEPARPPPRRRTPSPSPYDGVFRPPSDYGSDTEDEDSYGFRQLGRPEAAARSIARRANRLFDYAQDQWSEAESMLVHAQNAVPPLMTLYSSTKPTLGPESCREELEKGRIPESVLNMHTKKWSNSAENLRWAVQLFDEASSTYKRAEKVFKQAAKEFDELNLDDDWRENRNMVEEARRLAPEATVRANESQKKFEKTESVASAWSGADSRWRGALEV